MATETQDPTTTFLSFTTSASLDSSSPWSMMYTSDIMGATDIGFMNATEDFANVTAVVSSPHYIMVLKKFQRWLISTILVSIMLSMGAVITVDDFRQTFRHPVGFVVGFVSQFVMMPLICFIFAIVLDLEPPFALGLLIIGCCPGGTVSNLFTFWTNGDVCLSVCMTTVSCIAAIGMMPLNLFIYSRRWTTSQNKIPFINIFITLVTIIIPALFGMLVRRYSLKWAKRLSKVGAIAGLLCIPIVITLIGIINPGMFTSGWKVWFATFLLPFLGYAFGYGVSRLFRQPHFRCRTIGFETGVQNSALGVTIMILTFGDTDLLYDMLTVPSFYGILSFADFLVYVGIYRSVMAYKGRSEPKRMQNEEDDVEECRNVKDLEMAKEPGDKYHQLETDDDVVIKHSSNGDYKPIKTVDDDDAIADDP